MTEVIKTTDYYKFKNLVGNRGLKNRVEGIKESIKKIGWVSIPIIVNENMEIIDGQARFNALRELGMPIEYQKIPGLDIDDCRTLNTYNRSWDTKEFTESFAKEGNISYVRLNNLMTTFNVGQFDIVLRAMGKTCKKKDLSEGKLVVTDSDFGKAYKRLSFMNKLIPLFKDTTGRVRTKACGIFWISDYAGVDEKDLIDRIKNSNPAEIYGESVVHFLDSIQKIYNKNKPKNKRIYFAEDYRKEMG